MSLFFELTQVTALYGIYPRPYRLFDMSDLIGNTTGTLIGFWVTPLLVFFLPTKAKMDEIAYKRGEKISILRRSLAFLLDWAVVGIGLGASLFLGAVVPFWLCGLIYFVLVPILTKGYTIGSYLCSFKIIDKNGEKSSVWRYIVRAGLLYLPVFSTMGLWLVESKIHEKVPQVIIKGVVTVGNIMEFVTLICILTLVLQSVQKLFNSEKRYYYEVMSGTFLVSTISSKTYFEEENQVSEPEENENQDDWVYQVTTEE